MCLITQRMAAIDELCNKISRDADGKGVSSSFHEAIAECNFSFSYRKD